MTFLYEPQPYRTTLSTKYKDLILSTQWNTWLTQVLDNIGIIATVRKPTSVTADIKLTQYQYDLVVYASFNSIDMTLPDCQVFTGKEYRVHGYDVTFPVTLLTTNSQQIRRVITDTTTSKVINAGDVVVLVSLGGFWKICQ
jgi:hypothetical protein